MEILEKAKQSGVEFQRSIEKLQGMPDTSQQFDDSQLLGMSEQQLNFLVTNQKLLPAEATRIILLQKRRAMQLEREQAEAKGY